MGDVGECEINEVRRAEYVGVQRDLIGLERWPQAGECAVGIRRDFPDIGAQLRVDRHNDRVGVADRPGSNRLRRTFGNPGDVTDLQHGAALRADGTRRQFVCRGELPAGVDRDLFVRVVEHAGAADCRGAAGCRDQIGKSEARSAKPREIGMDLQLAHLASEDRDAPDSGDSQQARTKGPIRKGPDVAQRSRGRREAHHQRRAGG